MVVVTGEIAFRTFDFDHARAGVGEPAGALRRRHGLLDGNDKETREREHHDSRSASSIWELDSRVRGNERLWSACSTHFRSSRRTSGPNFHKNIAIISI